MSEDEIVKYAPLIRQAVEDYHTKGKQLVTQLAHQLKCPETEINEWWRFRLEPEQTSGSLGAWHYWFHGFECRFENQDTGQDIDFSLRGFGSAGTRIDPWFFMGFVETTPAYSTLASALGTDFDLASKALQVALGPDHSGSIPGED